MANSKRLLKKSSDAMKMNQPVLVGTVSIENSETLVRNAEEEEALRIKYSTRSIMRRKRKSFRAQGNRAPLRLRRTWQAAVLIFCLARRFHELGGLHIIGTERHESRRIDNQLRGRAGRQGDPGSSQFYLSLEDELMRRFGSENIMGMMERLGLDEDQPIESRLISRAIESAQKRVEGNNFDQRKVVLQYDDVMNQQREIIYKQRREVL